MARRDLPPGARGAQRPRKWEQLEEGWRWCPECRCQTEHDAEGCVDCGILDIPDTPPQAEEAGNE